MPLQNCAYASGIEGSATQCCPSSSGQDFNFALLPYDHWWRRHRRAFSQHIPSIVPPEYSLIQQQYVFIFLQKLLTDPAGLCDHIR